MAVQPSLVLVNALLPDTPAASRQKPIETAAHLLPGVRFFGRSGAKNH
jgi:hypothetical protein